MSDSVNPEQSPAAEGSSKAPANKDRSPKKQPKKLFELKVSASLFKSLCRKAEDEGVEPNELAVELLSEGLVLRAWEIVERKSAMRGHSGNTSGNGGGRNGGHHPNSRARGEGGGHNSKNRRGNHNNRGNSNNNNHNQRSNQGHGAALNLMEDKAAWMEYVRSQEKNRR